jgi:hypothetical protein
MISLRRHPVRINSRASTPATPPTFTADSHMHAHHQQDG